MGSQNTKITSNPASLSWDYHVRGVKYSVSFVSTCGKMKPIDIQRTVESVEHVIWKLGCIACPILSLKIQSDMVRPLYSSTENTTTKNKSRKKTNTKSKSSRKTTGAYSPSGMRSSTS